MALTDQKWDWILNHANGKFSAIDFAGKKHVFNLKVSEQDNIGYTIYAIEDTKAEHKYEFQASSYSCPHEAYIKLITKIRTQLATKQIIKTKDGFNLINNFAQGRIVENGIMIDGEFFTWQQLMSQMQCYEGWEFELRFKDGHE